MKKQCPMWLLFLLSRMYLGDLPHVEAHRGDHVFVELAACDNVNEGRLAGVLKADQREFHLLLPEEGFEPLQEAIYHGQHLGEVLS